MPRITTPVIPQPSTRILSMQGGGLLAMTGDAGFVSGLLKYYNTDNLKTNDKTVSAVFSKINTISANSGSTWFTNLLAYEPTFSSGIQNNNLFKTGFMYKMGQSWSNYLNSGTNNIKSLLGDTVYNKIVTNVAKVAGKSQNDIKQYIGFLAQETSWSNFLDQVVFNPEQSYVKLKNTNFSNLVSRANGPLSSQSLVYAAAFPVNAAINYYKDYVLGAKSTTYANIQNAGSYNFIPSSIVSLGAQGGVKAPALPSISSGSLNINYKATEYGLLSNTVKSEYYNTPKINFNGLTAYTASAISSAALAAPASSTVIQNTLKGIKIPLVNTPLSDFLPNPILDALTNTLKDYAPLVKTDAAGTVSDTKKNQFGRKATTPVQAMNAGFLRMADGGYIDNSSLTNGLSHLQANGKLNNFSATLFSYTGAGDTDANLAGKGGFTSAQWGGIGNETLRLFSGSSAGKNSQLFYGVADVSHPTEAIFNPTKTTGVATPVWEFLDNNNTPNNILDDFKLDYYKLVVETTTNNFGLTSGVKGELNVWVVATPVKSLPLLNATGDTAWSQYSGLHDDISLALNSNGTSGTSRAATGAQLLAANLGIA